MAQDITDHHRYSGHALHRHRWDKVVQCITLLYIAQDLQEVMAASTRIQELAMVRGQWDEGKDHLGKDRLDIRRIKDKDKGWIQEEINNRRGQGRLLL